MRATAWMLLLFVVILSGVASAAPRYASPECQTTIERMIEAHGGMERWRSAPTVSFDRKATLSSDPNPWVLSETIEQGSRRLYQKWPNDDAMLMSDGADVWTVNWAKLFPPRFVAQIGYYFLNMPWITQDAGVVLGEPGRGSHPASEDEFVTIPMTFEPGTGDTPNDRYVLYIDLQSYELRAIEYHVSYGALLDAAYLKPSVKTIGPFVHVNRVFETVEGLKVPVRYDVYDPSGALSIAGEVGNWSFAKSFDEAMMERPAEAVTDTSSPRRRVE